MKRIFIEQLSVEGFGSFQTPTTFMLDQKGLTLVKGKNGGGKTTLFSALCWVLFKVNLKGANNEKVQTWEHRRLPSYKGTKVQVLFVVDGVEYTVVRHINYKELTHGIKGASTLMIFKNGEMLGEAQHKNDQQAYIEHLLGVNSRTFVNSILFGQRMARLVTATGEEKRKLFESIFDLDFVESAKEKAIAKKAELTSGMVKAGNLSQNMLTKIETVNQSIERETEILATYETDKQARIAKIKLELEEENTNKAELEVELLELSKIGIENTENIGKLEQTKLTTQENLNAENEKLRELNRLITSTDREVDDIGKKISRLLRDLECVKENCPACKKPLDKKEVAEAKKVLMDSVKLERKAVDIILKQVPKDTREEIKEQILLFETQLLGDKKAIEIYIGSVKPMREAAVKRAEVAHELKITVEKTIPKIQENLAKEQDVEPPKDNTSKLTLQRTELENGHKQVALIIEELTSELELVKFWSDKAFGAGGVKAFVFSAMLNSLNEYNKKYAGRLGVRAKFGVDLSKASKPFTTTCFYGENEVDYSDLSGGQQQRIDICLAFATHDLVNSTTWFNLLILDEVFEGLDDEGIETVFDLIRLKAGEDRSVFVITHAPMIDSLNAKSIQVDLNEENCSCIS